MAKTNKALLKRVKITRRGKVLVRIPGQDHFNAKESGKKKLRQKGFRDFKIKKKVLKHYLPYAKI